MKQYPNLISVEHGMVDWPCQHPKGCWITDTDETGSSTQYWGCSFCLAELPRPLTVIDHLRRLRGKLETALGLNTIPF